MYVLLVSDLLDFVFIHVKCLGTLKFWGGLLQKIVLFLKKHQSWFMHAKLSFSGLCGGTLRCKMQMYTH